MLKDKVYIYSLEYPLGNVRYIGKTEDLTKRLNGHLNKLESSTHKVCWIKGLKKEGKEPIMKVIDKVPKDNWPFWESHYISLFKSWGFKLTNLTLGGDGMSNPTKEVREKISKSIKEVYKNGFEPWNKGLKGFNSGENSVHYGKEKSQSVKDKISKTKKEYFKTNDVWNKGIKTGHTPWNKNKKGVMPEPWNKGSKGVMKAWNKGVSMSEESKRKCSINSTHSRAVLQYSLEGEFIKEWVSAAEAKRYIRCNGIEVCCSGKARSAGGFLWLWKDEFSEELLKERIDAFKNKNKNMRRGRVATLHLLLLLIKYTLLHLILLRFGVV